jgi:hypothetical protein
LRYERRRQERRIDSRKSSCETPPIGNTSSCYDDHWLTGERALRVLAEIHYSRDQNGKRGVSSMSSALSALSTDHINA